MPQVRKDLFVTLLVIGGLGLFGNPTLNTALVVPAAALTMGRWNLACEVRPNFVRQILFFLGVNVVAHISASFLYAAISVVHKSPDVPRALLIAGLAAAAGIAWFLKGAAGLSTVVSKWWSVKAAVAT